MYRFLLKNTFKTLLMSLFLFSLISCGKPCEPTEEPKLNTGFYGKIPFKFKKIYAVGTPKITFEAIPAREINFDDFQLRKELLLPINLNAKTTKYIIESDTRIDSITIACDLQTNYTSKCGLTFILTNMRLVPEQSSFKDVEVNYYPPGERKQVFFLDAPYEARFEMLVRY